MSFDFISTVLFGQAPAESWLQSPALLGLLQVTIAFVLPILAGVWLARILRLPDMAWKLSLIFVCICVGLVICIWLPVEPGIDLKGGTIIVYEIDPEHVKDEQGAQRGGANVNWSLLVARLKGRIDPSGTLGVDVRKFGDRQVEIIIPKTETSELERIKKLISTAGSLAFRIVANSSQHGDTIQAAVRQAQAEDPAKRRSRYVLDDTGKTIGYWARVGREVNPVPGDFRPLKVNVANYTIRNSATGELIQLPPNLPLGEQYALERWLKQQGIQDIDVLMYAADGYDVTGEHLGVVSRSYDEVANPCVHFNMNGTGAGLMGGLTGDNLPDAQRGFYSLLGIMLDGELLSAPRVMSTITDAGRITGSFTQEEVDFLVGILQAGSLPSALNKVPISQNTIGAVMGEETIRKGKLAAAVALASTFVFMLLWYRLSGFIACLALAMNLLLTLAIMSVPFDTPMTLPGLAGFVLSMGMAVDANVLVYERMREELERGAALRMAIRNGYDRAMVTIVDSNLTTLIAAVVMYCIGSEDIRGFAITMGVGIVVSMFTAVFCTRVIFDILDRTRRITTVRMAKLFAVTHIDFLGKKHIAIGLSLLLIVVGLVATAARGRQMFDIDFLGGTSVTMILKAPAEEREIRKKLNAKFAGMTVDKSAVQYSVYRIDVEGQPYGTVWKIDTSLKEVSELEAILQNEFPVAMHSMTVTQTVEKRIPLSPVTPQAREETKPAEAKPAEAKPAEAKPAEAKPAEAKPAESDAAPPKAAKPAAGDSSRREPLPATTLAMAGMGELSLALADAGASGETAAAKAEAPQPAAPKAAEAKPAKPQAAEKPPAESKDAAPEAKPAAKPAAAGEPPRPGAAAKPTEKIVTEATLTFDNKINGRTVQHEVEQAAEEVGVSLTEEDVTVTLNAKDLRDNPDWNIEASLGYKEWIVSLARDRATAEKVFQQLSKRMSATPVWSSSSKFGGKVVEKARTQAIVALVASWFLIVIYIWIRFQKVVFGLAAVVALIHDVFVSLAAVAVSYYLAGVLGFLEIEEFKISLTVVVAFLTIIGYSVNDTIVVFDRIREVRGKSPTLGQDMVNLSVNQTLSRTLLTGLCTIVNTVILYAIGGEGIHAFAYTLLIGFVSGTYSSIYIAAPFVLWLYGGKVVPKSADA